MKSINEFATEYAQDKYLPVQTSQAVKAGANYVLDHLSMTICVSDDGYLRDNLRKMIELLKKGIEYIFPELKESEDEKIRKELVQFFEEKDEEDFEEWIPKAKVLAWLEKQGEQKYIPWYDLEKSKEAGYTIVPNEEYDRLTKHAEWSEEDESHIRYLIECLEHCKKGVALTMTTSTSQEYINWLKSLRPQSHWKPSEEQLEALDDAIAICSERDYETECRLDNLRQELKKLREE